MQDVGSQRIRVRDRVRDMQSARHFQCVDCNVLSQRCFAGQTLHHIRCHARGFFGGCGSALRSVVVVSVSHGWGWRLARWCLQWVSWVRLTEHVNACAQCGDGGNPRQSISRFIVLFPLPGQSQRSSWRWHAQRDCTLRTRKQSGTQSISSGSLASACACELCPARSHTCARSDGVAFNGCASLVPSKHE
jgi:hypothetical protein